MKIYQAEKSKKGYPTFWECGGGYSNTGFAQCISDSHGSRKTPVFVRTGGHLACAEHALFVINEGDYVCSVNRSRDDVTIYLRQLGRSHSTEDSNKLSVDILHEWNYSNGEWDNVPPYFLEEDNGLCHSTVDKSYLYHCRSMCFGNTPNSKY